MTKKKLTSPTQPLPSMGGSYIRAADGSLIVEEQPQTAQVEPDGTDEAVSDPAPAVNSEVEG